MPRTTREQLAKVDAAGCAVAIRGVSKTFRKHTITKKSYSTLKTSLVSRLLKRGGDGAVMLKALKELSIDIPKGSSLGVIGRNGSGKSTLLKLIAGIYRPDKGEVEVNGRVAALIELGAGFHPDFTGRENIYLGGVMYGLSRKEIDERFDDIVRFAELEEFIDDPVRTYSSGMFMRLGFSVAVHTDPDILLVDEVLAVGDASFIHRCHERISEFRRQGKTLIFVTHDLNSVARWCDHAVWLHKGEVRAEGEPRWVIDHYLQDVEESERQTLERENDQTQQEAREDVTTEAPEEPEDLNRWGDRRVEIVNVKMTGTRSGEGWLFHADEGARIDIDYKVNEPVKELVFGVGLLRADGTVVFGTNTGIEGVEVPPAEAPSSDIHTCAVHIDRLYLTDGNYFLDVAAHRSDGLAYDYHHLLYKLSIRNPIPFHGLFSPAHKWEFFSERLAKQKIQGQGAR